VCISFFFFFQAEDGIRDFHVTGVQTCALPISTLVFSFIGYESQRIVVGGRSVIDVVLSEDLTSLDEVVVVGYGVQKKVNLTGSVDVISNEKLSNRQAPTVSQMLQGLSPGLNFDIGDQGGFQPGASMNITV